MWEREGIIRRYSGNPILLPIAEHDWESRLVYNCAAFHLNETIFLVYRAMGKDHIARFGLAYSEDGIHFERLPYPILFPKTHYELPHQEALQRERERGGVEDPRVIVIHGEIYLLYTAFHQRCHLALAKMSLKKFEQLFERSKECQATQFSQVWNNAWERLGLLFPAHFADPGMFSRNAVLTKITDDLHLLFYRINKGDIVISHAQSPAGPWDDQRIPLLRKTFPWENERIGISTPPIEIATGLQPKSVSSPKMGGGGVRDDTKRLFFYHGVELISKGGKPFRIYHLGAFFMSARIEKGTLLLDIEKITRPVLSPVRDYEIQSEWLLPVNVHAVFSCGAVPISDDEIYVYYGAGDANINLGKVCIADLVNENKLSERIEMDIE